MIELQVEDYCQDCPNFNPVSKVQTLYANAWETTRDIHVQCESRSRCAALVKFLSKRLDKKEGSHDMDNGS